MLTTEVLARLESVRARCVPARARFHAATDDARSKALLRAAGAAPTRRSARRSSPVLTTASTGLAREAVEYLHCCDWALYDVFALAVAIGADGTAVEALIGPVLVYQSLRLVDDVVDGHRSYKGAYETLYGYLRRHYDDPEARWLRLARRHGRRPARGGAPRCGSRRAHAAHRGRHGAGQAPTLRPTRGLPPHGRAQDGVLQPPHLRPGAQGRWPSRRRTDRGLLRRLLRARAGSQRSRGLRGTRRASSPTSGPPTVAKLRPRCSHASRSSRR